MNCTTFEFAPINDALSAGESNVVTLISTLRKSLTYPKRKVQYDNISPRKYTSGPLVSCSINT